MSRIWQGISTRWLKTLQLIGKKERKEVKEEKGSEGPKACSSNYGINLVAWKFLIFLLALAVKKVMRGTKEGIPGREGNR